MPVNKISVFTQKGMEHSRNILRESERENNDTVREDLPGFNGPTRVYFEITSEQRNARGRYPGIIKELELLEDTTLSADRLVDGEVIEVVSIMNLNDDVMYEGVIIGNTKNTLIPIVSVALGGKELEIPIAYCDSNGELAYYYICATVLNWRIGRCKESSSSSSS